MNDLLYDLIRYVDLEMFFDKYDDFVKRAKIIKKKYKELSWNGVKVYKTYVYEKNIKMNRKDRLWEYLNDDLRYANLPKRGGSKYD